MEFWILPGAQKQLRSDLSRAEIIRRLHAELGSDQLWQLLKVSAFGGKKPFVGYAEDDHFRLWKLTRKKNSWRRILHGTIECHGSGSVLTYRFDCSMFAKLLTCLFIFAELYFACGERFARPDSGLLVFLLVGVSLPQLAQLMDRRAEREAEEFLRRITEGRVQTNR